MKVINCSKCGSRAVTLNGKTCINISSGLICGGKISKIDIIPDASLHIRFPKEGSYDYLDLANYLVNDGWRILDPKSYTKDGDEWMLFRLEREA